MARMRRFFLLSACLLCVSAAATAQTTLPADLTAKIDAAVTDALKSTGAPSASIAVVKDGQLAYAHAYGLANVETKAAAMPAMRYSIGSVSKQFAASAILLLAEEGKLSLDDKVEKFVPGLTRGGDVTLRQLLSMTSGYQDYWPQDYVMPGMLKPVTPDEIVSRWAKIPLDFEPGTQWQYSNTNYVIVGLVVQKVSGQPLFDFLQQRIFSKLAMTTIQNIDEAALGPSDAARYTRVATAPVRPAPKEGRGWIFAAGELAMTASDLAKWDISLIQQSVLKPESYRALETETLLANGAGTGYGLGVSVRMGAGHRLIVHTGEVSGFTAYNGVYPDDKIAVVVLVNLDASGASGIAANKISQLLLAPPSEQAPLAQAKQILAGLQKGTIDRTLLTDNASFYFSPQALKDFESSLGPLGEPTGVTQEGQSLRGGMTFRSFRAVYAKETLRITTFTMPDGKLEQFQVAPE
jgi:CubicO group peptidase (beta-lactamase class C family)